METLLTFIPTILASSGGSGASGVMATFLMFGSVGYSTLLCAHLTRIGYIAITRGLSAAKNEVKHLLDEFRIKVEDK